MTYPIRRYLVAALVCMPLIGCGHCGGEAAISPREVIPNDARGVVWVPRLGNAVQGLGDFIGRATRRGGASLVSGLRRSMTQQVGLDLLALDQLAASGVDPAHGLVAFVPADASTLLWVVPVRDRSVFDGALKSVVANVAGAEKLSERSLGGALWHTAGRPFGDEVAPVLHWVHVGNYALLGPAAGEVALRAALQRAQALVSAPKDAVLHPASSAPWVALQRRVGDGDLYVYEAGASLFGGAVENAISSVRVGAFGTTAEIFFGVADLATGHLPAAKAPGELAARVDDDALGVFVSQVLNADTLALLRRHPNFDKPWQKALGVLSRTTGLDAERELLPLLLGPLTLAVHLGDLSQVHSLLRMKNLPKVLRGIFEIALVAEVRDPAAMGEALGRSAAKLAGQGQKIAQRQVEVAGHEASVFEPEGSPEIGWALWERYYVYGIGVGRWDKTLQRLAGTASTPALSLQQSAAAAPLATRRGASLGVLRLGQLADEVSKRGGAGLASRMGMGALIDQAFEVLRALGDVATCIEVAPGGVRVTLREQLR